MHESTGTARLDELTGGGPVYGTRAYLIGAPDAGKTALLVQFAHIFAGRGIAVGLLAADEEPGDIVTRLVQRVGYERHACEARDPLELDQIAAELAHLPIRIYDDRWTIEAAATDLAAYACEQTKGRAMLGVDSIQTVRCDAELTAEREMSEVAAVTARTRAVRAMATRHRLIAIATSEMGRGGYRSNDPEQQTATLASGKWSGAIEYSARIILGVRSVPGEKDLIDVEIAKNKHGPRGEHIYLRIDRRSQTLNEVTYTPEPMPTQKDRDAVARDRVVADAAAIAEILSQHPGTGARDLRSKARAAAGIGSERVDAAVALLDEYESIKREEGKRGAKLLSFAPADPDDLPDAIRAVLGGRNA